VSLGAIAIVWALVMPALLSIREALRDVGEKAAFGRRPERLVGGQRAPGPTASIMGASLLIAIAAALVLTIDRMTLLYAALSGVAATIALAAVVNAFVQDPRGIGNSCGSGSGRPVRLAGRVVAGRALRSVRARHHPGLIRANTAIERGEENPHAN